MIFDQGWLARIVIGSPIILDQGWCALIVIGSPMILDQGWCQMGSCSLLDGGAERNRPAQVSPKAKCIHTISDQLLGGCECVALIVIGSPMILDQG